MRLLDIGKELAGNSYPGRGIIIGKSEEGKHAVIAYFIMGRSINSRNRIFVADGDGLRTEAHDPALLSDPALVIYSPVKVLGDRLIVTNGDQTDTIYDHLKEGKTFEDALRTRTFEPDPPSFTPRISGMLSFTDNDFTYQMSILKTLNGDEAQPQRFFFDYVSSDGLGHFIHTYKEDGNPRIPSFEGEPELITIDGNIDSFTNTLWLNLNEDNRVSLFVRYVDLSTGKCESRIINKNL